MAKYTTEVRSICETLAGYTEQQGFGEIESIIKTAAPLLFNFNFPIFDEEYRLPLECKILRHFYTREIGEESVGLWKLRLDAKLNDIMPYYNQLYESQLLEFNPFYDVNVSTAGTKDTSGSTEGSKEGTSSSTTVTGTETSNTTILDRDDFEKTTGSSSTEENETGSQNTAREQDDTGSVKVVASDDATAVVTTSNSGTSNNTTTKNADNWEKYSDTPQGGISGISSDTYLTNAENDIVDEDGTSNTTTTDTGTQNTTTSDDNTKTTTNDLNTSESITVGTTNNKTADTADTTDRTYGQDSTTTDSGKLDSTVTKTGGTGETSVGSSTEAVDYAETVLGKRGSTSYSKLLQEFRETFLNIDLQVIHQLNDLFLNLW